MADIFFLFLKSQFKNLYLRKVVYLIVSPIMSGMLIASLLLNSYFSLFICTISYFFVVDAIAIPAPGIIADISKFFCVQKSLLKIYFTYTLYRLMMSFVMSYLPALLVFTSLVSFSMKDIPHLPLALSVVVFSLAWIFFIIASVPMLILAFRKRIFYELYGFFAFPVYSILIIVQLELGLKLEILAYYLVFLLVMIIAVFITIGIAFKLLIKSELLYPEKRERKLGY